MVKKEDSVVLLKLLKLGEVEGKSFESIVEEEFRSEFELIRYHKACYTLASILELKVLNPSKRLVAFAIIRQAFSYPKFSSNPFMPFLINAACDEEADKCERAFILHLLGCATIKEQSYLQAATSSLTTYVLKKSFQEFMRSCDPSKYVCEKSLRLMIHQKGLAPCLIKTLRNVIPDPDVPTGCDSDSAEFDLKPKIGCGNVDKAIIGLISNMSLKGLQPQWKRPFPPRLPVLDNDLVWLNPDDKDHHLLWDHGMCGVELVAKAFKSPLNPSEQKQILMDLEKNPMLVYHCGLTPITLVELVEKNPLIAVKALVKLVNSPVIANYFTALVDNEMSPHSMAVVYNLTQADNVKLPTEFIHSCITKSISSCKNIKDDEFSQERRARLVCVFIQNLIQKDNSIVGRELLNEVRSFCMQFSWTSEADKLLQLLGSWNIAE